MKKNKHSLVSVKGSKEIIKMFNFLKLNVTKDQCQKLVTDIFFSSKDVLERIQKFKEWGEFS